MRTLLFVAAVCGALLAGCGRKAEEAAPSAPAAKQASAPAPSTATPAAAPEPTRNRPADDGETVEDAAIQVSPVAAAIAAATPSPQAPMAPGWIEGQHYKALPSPQPTSVPAGTIEVTEIFWYGCGHCYHLHPALEAWNARGRPDYVKLTYLPVVWNAVTREDARLFFTLEALGKVPALQSAVFREMHVNGNPLTVISGSQVDTAATEKKVREFLTRNGVSAEDFNRTYRSFAVENKLRSAEIMLRRYMADHTPMIIVNGKWVTDVQMAGGPDPLFRLVNALAARERGR
jgi:thiol:disulfide interchange protein DsbA